MKSFFAILLSVLLLAALPVTAAASPEHSGISHQWQTTEAVSYPAGSYCTEKWLERFPVTLEAWVCIPLEQHPAAAGTVIGNYAMKQTDCFTLSVEAGGVVQLTIGRFEKDLVFRFSEALIPPDAWTHVAVVYGMDGGEVACYLNGTLTQSITPERWYVPPEAVLENILCLAGDYRPVNQNGFRGILGDVTLYADARTSDEILSDMTAPDLQDPDLLLHYAMDGAVPQSHIPDASGNGYDMRYEKTWLTPQERDALLQQEGREYAYSIAFLPDVQYTTRHYPDRLKPIFDFLVENRDAENIQYLITLGDMTDANTQKEWDAFSAQLQRLEGVLPYALVRGNHDILRNNSDPIYDTFYGTADTAYFAHIQENGGFYNPSNTRNTYLLFQAGEQKYLILNLDFGARDNILVWANKILQKYPDRRVIVVTHGYLKTNGQRLTGTEYAAPPYYFSYFNDGAAFWEKLIKKHTNIEMVVCGHYAVDNVIYAPAVGDHGNTVHQLLIDPQSTDKLLKGLGIVTMMYFTEDGNFARVEHYSTVHDLYFKETTSRLRLDLRKAEPAEEAPAEIPAQAGPPKYLLIAAIAAAAALIVVVTTTVIRKKA